MEGILNYRKHLSEFGRSMYRVNFDTKQSISELRHQVRFINRSALKVSIDSSSIKAHVKMMDDRRDKLIEMAESTRKEAVRQNISDKVRKLIINNELKSSLMGHVGIFNTKVDPERAMMQIREKAKEEKEESVKSGDHHAGTVASDVIKKEKVYRDQNRVYNPLQRYKLKKKINAGSLKCLESISRKTHKKALSLSYNIKFEMVTPNIPTFKYYRSSNNSILRHTDYITKQDTVINTHMSQGTNHTSQGRNKDTSDTMKKRLKGIVDFSKMKGHDTILQSDKPPQYNQQSMLPTSNNRSISGRMNISSSSTHLHASHNNTIRVDKDDRSVNKERSPFYLQMSRSSTSIHRQKMLTKKSMIPVIYPSYKLVDRSTPSTRILNSDYTGPVRHTVMMI